MSVQIFGNQATEERAENARMLAFVGAIAVGDLVKLTLGPKGMDKLLQLALDPALSTTTNDGATILKLIPLDNPAAKVLVSIAKVQDDEVGDGTTLVTVLGLELLREAEKLVERKMHPQTIIEGYRIACSTALAALERAAVNNGGDAARFRADLESIAKTTLSLKILAQDKEHFAQLAVDAVLRLKGLTNLNHIQIIKKPGGRLADLYLDDGFILEKRFGVGQPKVVHDARILVANTALDTDKVKVFGAKFKVDATAKLAELEKAEKAKMRAKIEKIKKLGCNVFVNRQLVYDYPEQLLSDAKINSVEHADFDGVERIALVTGAEVASTFDSLIRLGRCDRIEEVLIGEDVFLKFLGVQAGEACTVVLRGATELALAEAERLLHDALCVLSQTTRETRTVLGGGCAEMVMLKAVEQAAANETGKKLLAIEAFARALRALPTILADNAGFDLSELVAKLRAAIYSGMTTLGLDLDRGAVADMRELEVVELYKLKRAVVLLALEAAEVLLRVDNILRAKPRTADRNQ